jgi:iron complex transport system substrate-binding protein
LVRTRVRLGLPYRAGARWRVAMLLALLAACRAAPARPAAGDSAIVLTDDAGRELHLPRPARRVISLIPSITETIIALGAADRIVGRTRYDTARAIAARPLVGGTIDPSIETIAALEPDVVITWAPDARGAQAEALTRAGLATFTLRTEDTTDVFSGIARLGRLLGRETAADSLARAVRAGLDTVARSVAGRPRPSVFYVVYNDPPMTAGPYTFIGQLITIAGGRSIFADVPANWPTVSLEEIVRRNPDVVVLPEGERRGDTLARLRELPGWRDLEAVRAGRVIRVPADLVNRPGPALARAARLLRDGLHPELARPTGARASGTGGRRVGAER